MDLISNQFSGGDVTVDQSTTIWEMELQFKPTLWGEKVWLCLSNIHHYQLQHQLNPTLNIAQQELKIKVQCLQ